MKKFLAVILAVIMMIGTAVIFAGAEDAAELKFSDDGKFTIVHLTDIQDGYPMIKTTKTFIQEMLVTINPDLVILGGDNIVCDPADIEAGIKEICDLFTESKTYFTLVFGNHDHQGGRGGNNGFDNKDVLFEYYRQYGGEYCLAYDADPALFGTGTHVLPVKSSDGTKTAYALYMFDSNTYYPDEEHSIDYDAVHTDEIEWYKATAAELKAANGGETVKAMAFQHIIPQEIYEVMYPESPVSLGDAGRTYESVKYEGKKYYTLIPKLSLLKSGYVFEAPCPGYYNYGQLDAFKETGDVVAVFAGHDHTNSFVVDIDGIDVATTGGCTYNSYGNVLNRGVRVITLDEKDTSTYETYTYTVAKAATAEGSKIPEQGEMSKFAANFYVFLDKFCSFFTPIIGSLFRLFGM